MTAIIIALYLNTCVDSRIALTYLNKSKNKKTNNNNKIVHKLHLQLQLTHKCENRLIFLWLSDIYSLNHISVKLYNLCSIFFLYSTLFLRFSFFSSIPFHSTLSIQFRSFNVFHLKWTIFLFSFIFFHLPFFFFFFLFSCVSFHWYDLHVNSFSCLFLFLSSFLTKNETIHINSIYVNHNNILQLLLQFSFTTNLVKFNW